MNQLLIFHDPPTLPTLNSGSSGFAGILPPRKDEIKTLRQHWFFIIFTKSISPFIKYRFKRYRQTIRPLKVLKQSSLELFAHLHISTPPGRLTKTTRGLPPVSSMQANLSWEQVSRCQAIARWFLDTMGWKWAWFSHLCSAASAVASDQPFCQASLSAAGANNASDRRHWALSAEEIAPNYKCVLQNKVYPKMWPYQ